MKTTMSKGRKPDYRVAAMLKSTDQKSQVGAAWINEDGSIAVVLNEFTVLPPGGKDLLITLFPNKDEPK